jgi:methyl-accepting chemotaxis protein
VGAPDETTDHYWRFTRGLAAGGTETFTVTESSGRQRTYLLANTGPDEVSFFLSSGFIDERVARSLREIISLRERVARRSEEVRQRTEERSQLFKDQERIRANIESLKSGTPQRELVARFVTKLNEQEDRLEGIARELERLSQEQREAQEEVNRQIQRLAFSTEPGKP